MDRTRLVQKSLTDYADIKIQYQTSTSLKSLRIRNYQLHIEVNQKYVLLIFFIIRETSWAISTILKRAAMYLIHSILWAPHPTGTSFRSLWTLPRAQDHHISLGLPAKQKWSHSTLSTRNPKQRLWRTTPLLRTCPKGRMASPRPTPPST